MRPNDLLAFGVPSELIDKWAAEFTDLTDVQERAIRAGLLLGDRNLLVAAPTGSGKTLIGEMAAAIAAYSGRRRSVFAVPFKALAEEHYLRMKTRYDGLLSVVISDGDWSEFDDDIRRGTFNLGVVTYEKLAALVSREPALLEQLTALVVDEIQMLGDQGRGANLEVFLTRLLTAPSQPRLIGLSASIEDLAPLATWLGADVVASQDRPVPLTELVVGPDGRAVTLVDEVAHVVRAFPSGLDREVQLVDACRTLVDEGSQVLVFRSAVRQTADFAHRLLSTLPATGMPDAVARALAEIEDPDVVGTFGRLLAARVGFHNADLAADERRLLEEAFRRGDIRVLVATTTLAMGVNLPCDWVIVGDTTRFAAGRQTAISVSEYKNAAGRAGRLGQQSAGHSVVFANNAAEARQLLNEYVAGTTEPVESQIPRRPFQDLVFRVLCDELAQDQAGLVEFLTATYAYQTFYEPRGDGLAAITEAADAALDRCVASGLIVQANSHFLPTPPAKQLAMAGFGLASSIRLAGEIPALRDGLEGMLDLLFAAAACEEAGDRPWPARQFRQAVDPRPGMQIDAGGMRTNGPLSRLMSQPVISDADKGALTRLACVLDWTGGKPVREITRQFQGAAPVRVQTLGKNVAALLESLTRASIVARLSAEHVRRVAALALSCRYGVPGELAPLARLRVPGVGREVLLPFLMHPTARAFIDPDALLGGTYDDVAGVLTPPQYDRVIAAIERDTVDRISRHRSGQIARAGQAAVPEQLMRGLYEREGTALEQAVCDALSHVGLVVSRLLRQPHGEEDLRIAHRDGTVVVSVTASRDSGRPVAWAKAREVLGAGAGINPVNYVCVGRPRFDTLAIRRAADISREAGGRSLLLLTIPALGELILRCAEGRMTGQQLADFFASAAGAFDTADLEVLEQGSDSESRPEPLIAPTGSGDQTL